MTPCAWCPLRDRPAIRPAGTYPGHERFCARLDPSGPGYDPRFLEPYAKITAHLNRMGEAEVRGAIPPSDFPPISTQVVNLATSAARFVASGGAMATAEERARRLAICDACPYFDAGRCRQCGCRMRLKVWAVAMTCPIGKW